MTLPKVSPAVEALRRRVAALEQENAALRGQVEGFTEFEATLKAGRFDGRARSEWVRLFSEAAAAFFKGEGAVNFFEVTLYPHGPGSNFGPLVLTFQRSYGKTPGMLYGEVKRHYVARFRPVAWADIRPGVPYLARIRPERVAALIGTCDPGDVWQFARALQPADDFNRWLYVPSLSLNLRSDEEQTPYDLCELYELRDPDAPDPDRLPLERTRYGFITDVLYLKENAYIAGQYDPATVEPTGGIARGTVCTLRRWNDAQGSRRWYILPEGWNLSEDTPPLSFPDDGGEIPEYLRPLPADAPEAAQATEDAPDAAASPERPADGQEAASPRHTCPRLVTETQTGEWADACRAAPPCCDRAGEYNGYGSDGPRLFFCPKSCPCHD